MCRDDVCSKKKVFYERCVFHFFLRKCPVAVELNLKHRKLTKVVEQTLNVSTGSDRSKKLLSTVRHVFSIYENQTNIARKWSQVVDERIREKLELRTPKNNTIIIGLSDKHVSVFVFVSFIARRDNFFV